MVPYWGLTSEGHMTCKGVRAYRFKVCMLTAHFSSQSVSGRSSPKWSRKWSCLQESQTTSTQIPWKKPDTKNEGVKPLTISPWMLLISETKHGWVWLAFPWENVVVSRIQKRSFCLTFYGGPVGPFLPLWVICQLMPFGSTALLQMVLRILWLWKGNYNCQTSEIWLSLCHHLHFLPKKHSFLCVFVLYVCVGVYICIYACIDVYVCMCVSLRVCVCVCACPHRW